MIYDKVPVSEAEVPMPEPVGWIGWIRHEGGAGRHPMFSSYEPKAYPDRDQVAAMSDVRTYGDAREAEVWAKVAKALNLGTGVRFAESYLLAQIAECVALERDLLLAHQAGEAAGYARGLAEAGKDVERLNRLDQNLSLPIKSGWSAEVGVFGKIRLTTGPETQTSIRAAIDAALRGEVQP